MEPALRYKGRMEGDCSERKFQDDEDGIDNVDQMGVNNDEGGTGGNHEINNQEVEIVTGENRGSNSDHNTMNNLARMIQSELTRMSSELRKEINNCKSDMKY